MRLSVAANYDSALVARLAEYPVEEVYGKLPADLVGGGRPSFMGTPLSFKRLARYVARLNQHGIAFNYLLNAACLGNREWSGRWQRRLTALLDRLWRIGVRRLTVSTPILLEMVKTRFPRFHVKVGIYAQVDTPERARFWESLGADAICLESFSINRNFARLEAIRRAVQCDLQLIANHPCLPNCAMQPYHQNAFAHASDGSHQLFVDYCFLACTQRRLSDPTNLIKSQWIRPEDAAIYEAMGFTSFKLLERGIPSDELLKRVRAYSERRFEGNLAEILLPYGFRQEKPKGLGWLLRHFFRPWQINPFRLAPLYRFIRSQGMLFPKETTSVQIDASAIPPDFLSVFQSGRCKGLDCADCDYCERIAERAVQIEPEFRQRSLEQLAELQDAVRDGSLWGIHAN